MNRGTKVLLWTGGFLLVFTLLPIAEAWVLKYLGFDIVANLKLAYEKDTAKFVLESVGVVAFVLAQPLILLFIFGRLSAQIGKILEQNINYFLHG